MKTNQEKKKTHLFWSRNIFCINKYWNINVQILNTSKWKRKKENNKNLTDSYFRIFLFFSFWQNFLSTFYGLFHTKKSTKKKFFLNKPSWDINQYCKITLSTFIGNHHFHFKSRNPRKILAERWMKVLMICLRMYTYFITCLHNSLSIKSTVHHFAMHKTCLAMFYSYLRLLTRYSFHILSK